jgi:hypothetical protein
MCIFLYIRVFCHYVGSGKSYSMVGYGVNRGIIPLVCEKMFKSMKEKQDKWTKYQVRVCGCVCGNGEWKCVCMCVCECVSVYVKW